MNGSHSSFAFCAWDFHSIDSNFLMANQFANDRFHFCRRNVFASPSESISSSILQYFKQPDSFSRTDCTKFLLTLKKSHPCSSITIISPVLNPMSPLFQIFLSIFLVVSSDLPTYAWSEQPFLIKPFPTGNRSKYDVYETYLKFIRLPSVIVSHFSHQFTRFMRSTSDAKSRFGITNWITYNSTSQYFLAKHVCFAPMQILFAVQKFSNIQGYLTCLIDFYQTKWHDIKELRNESY